ncbi:methyltransferase TYW3-domain-containing protein [Podospora australis]|uniref:tRNA(Phe) 7-[(3-amino-3-carboxypropyl)-4-demethylwyosine(37)-N(4)]-methyltransferase n=1 Tax=Podospora australis TaxID=1536484 RepID=A0AAN6WW26_9PEZI|nr:methyltransferase TYW3-domain-containing protein [Podospora australis]
MRYPSYLLRLGLLACTSAQSLTTVLANNNATLSTLTTLLGLVPEVVQTLSAAQNVTIFAPSDPAFANLFARNPRSAELMRNPRALAGVLQYHVLVGKLLSTDFSATPKFPATLLAAPFANVTGGQKVQLALVNNTASVFSGYKQPASVVTADLEFDGNNVLHIIDTVLTVPASPGQTATNVGLTSLAGALASARLIGGIHSLRDITIFAPSNDAFRAIGSALGSIEATGLANILGYHVLTGTAWFSTDLLSADQMVLSTLQGPNVTVRRDGSNLFVNSAKVVLADVLTSNGVVHVLDTVLNPSNTTATPDPAATTQVPAFAGVSAVGDAPFTSGIMPTATFTPATKMKSTLPAPSAGFTARKNKILSDLAVPLDEYTDASPKGSVDIGIRDLIDEINAREGFVTTSSCAGRVSVYLEGHKPSSSASSSSKNNHHDEPETIVTSSAGGKGGGEWLFVSHDPVPFSGNYAELFGLGLARQTPPSGGDEVAGNKTEEKEEEEEYRLIRFKFEPMVCSEVPMLTRWQILHVLTASHEHAQLVIQAGMEAGFRETGAVSLLPKKPEEDPTPIVAVRSMGLSLESMVGMQDAAGNRWSLLGESSGYYLQQLVRTSHKLYAENQRRIARFRAALDRSLDFEAADVKKKKKKGEDWEDAETRRERKRLEGLQKREEVLRARQSQAAATGDAQPSGKDLMLAQPDVL